MSERGFICPAVSCMHKTHGECHLEYCPRLEQAYNLLHQCMEIFEEGPCIEEALASGIREFLNQDKSWDPECSVRHLENARKSLQCSPDSCKKGLTLCSNFFRTGDDYGNCLKSGKSCPHDGFVDVTNMEVK